MLWNKKEKRKKGKMEIRELEIKINNKKNLLDIK